MKLFSAELGNKSLKEELETVQNRIKAKPNDADLRSYLFQLLVLLGQWERASAQLQMCSKLDKRAIPMALLYENILRGEIERQAVFNGQKVANLLDIQDDTPVPLTWVSMLSEALHQKSSNFIELREKAFEEAKPCIGTITLQSQQDDDSTEEPFAWIIDGDSRIGPICEVVANGKYFWVPFNHIQEIRITPPQGLCDLVWANASVILIDGREQVCLIPARYPAPDGYVLQDDAAILSRRTSWEEQGSIPHYIGTGQKTWFSDNNEYPILNVRAIVFNHEHSNDVTEA